MTWQMLEWGIRGLGAAGMVYVCVELLRELRAGWWS